MDGVISLPREPDAAFRAAALHVAANDDRLEPGEILSACLGEIKARGGEVSEGGWLAARDAVAGFVCERDHRAFAA
jgi:hypothetical protein